MNASAVPQSHCPHCSFTSDLATALDGSGSTPVPGDVTVCANCGAYLYFGEGMTLRAMTYQEYLLLPGEIKEAMHEARETLRTARLMRN